MNYILSIYEMIIYKIHIKYSTATIQLSNCLKINVYKAFRLVFSHI